MVWKALIHHKTYLVCIVHHDVCLSLNGASIPSRRLRSALLMEKRALNLVQGGSFCVGSLVLGNVVYPHTP